MERRFATLSLEHLVIPAVIPEPQRQEHDGDKRAVDYGSNGKFEHRNCGLR
jgi:hypothetical protein